MNQSEILKHATEVASFNKFAGKVLAFSDGNVFFERSLADVNAAIQHSNNSGLTIYRISVTDQTIATTTNTSLVKEYSSAAAAAANGDDDASTAQMKHREITDDSSEDNVSKAMEEQEAIQVIGRSDSITDIESFIQGDEREAVIQSAKERIEVLNGASAKVSTQMTTKEAAALINQLKTKEEVEAFVAGDKRKTVIDAAAAQIKDIANS